MSRLPPAEKLPLAVRKNGKSWWPRPRPVRKMQHWLLTKSALGALVRDEFEVKKADFEKTLSDLMGTPWTIDINPQRHLPLRQGRMGQDVAGQLHRQVCSCYEGMKAMSLVSATANA